MRVLCQPECQQRRCGESGGVVGVVGRWLGLPSVPWRLSPPCHSSLPSRSKFSHSVGSSAAFSHGWTERNVNKWKDIHIFDIDEDGVNRLI